MILCVCLNPAIDRSADRVACQTSGGTDYTDQPGGKGFNVARALRRLGLEVTATGFLHEDTASVFLKTLGDEGITVDAVMLPGSERINLKLHDAATGRVEEHNAKGHVPPEAFCSMEDKLRSLVRAGDIVVFSGSLPEEMPDDTYYIYMKLVSALGARPVLDTSGEALRHGIEAKPLISKPNSEEISKIFEKKSDEKILAKMLAEKTDFALVSLGGRGAILASGGECLFAPALEVPVRGTVGAGDNMLAGAIYSYVNCFSLQEMLAFSVACASSAIRMEGTTFVEKDEAIKLCKLVKIM